MILLTDRTAVMGPGSHGTGQGDLKIVEPLFLDRGPGDKYVILVVKEICAVAKCEIRSCSIKEL